MLQYFRISMRRTLALVVLVSCFLSTGAAAADTASDTPAATAESTLSALPFGNAVSQLVDALSAQSAKDEVKDETKDETKDEIKTTEPATSDNVAAPAPKTAPVAKSSSGYTPVYHDSVAYRGKTVTTALHNNSVFAGQYRLSFYCPCRKCCGKSNGVTSTGTKAKEGRTIAINNSKLPMGSKVHIEGYGDFIVEDRGSMRSNVIDVFVSNHDKALQLGIKYANVYLIVE